MRTTTAQLYHPMFGRLTAIAVCLLIMLPALSTPIKTNYSISVSDGVLLDATLILPDSGAPGAGFPVVLLVHGYGGNKDNWTGFESYLIDLGYGCFTYSVRGQGNSGGLSSTMGTRERDDLLEVIQFLRAQPGVDPENIAVAGGSQGGIHAWMAATNNMPGVKTVATLIGPPSFALDLVSHDCIKQQLWAELNLSSVRYDPARDLVRDYVISDQYDSVHAYVVSRDLECLLDSVRIPVFQSLGWADVLFPANSAIRAIDKLTARSIPIWSYLGTNGHGEMNLAEYYYVIMDLIAPWFNRWLKGTPLNWSDVPFTVYADNRPTWPHHETLGWPPEPQGTLRLYLSGSKLQTAIPSQANEAQFALTYDSTYTQAQGWSDGYKGSAFVNAFSAAPTRFLSDPVADTVEITGVPYATMRVRSGAPQFQSHVRIYDVAPLDTGMVWSIMSRGADGVRDNTPGTLLTREYECHALSHLVPPGHRIGVEVTSLDMFDATRSHFIPYFTSSASWVSSSPASPSYVDIPIVGDAGFVSVAPSVAGHPSGIVLHQNFPNPFNPTTMVSCQLPVASHVSIVVFDMLGREVGKLVDQQTEAGTHQWRFDASNLASGVYFYRMTAGDYVATRRMILLR